MPKIFKNLFLIIISSIFILSCNNDDINKVTTIVVQPNNSQILLGTNFIFDVETDTSQNVTLESTIFIDGNAIEGNLFIPDHLGVYTVTAVYDSFTSESVQVEVVESSIYSHKILIEDYTGTWCGFCPRVNYAIELLRAETDHVVAVANHIRNGDPFLFDGSTSLSETFNIGGLPEGRINRIHKWDSPQNNNLNQALEYINVGGSPLGLAINSSINGNQIDTEIKVGFSQTLNTNLGLVVYLTENGLIHDQTNYTNFFPVGQYVDPLVNFVHNDVLRAIYTDELGDVIPLSETIQDNIYSINMSKNIPASVNDNSNLHLVAFVVNKDTNEVINAQESTVGENKDFD